MTVFVELMFALFTITRYIVIALIGFVAIMALAVAMQYAGSIL